MRKADGLGQAANIQGALHLPGYFGRRKRRRLAKVELRTLYVSRPVLNADQIVAWAKAQGFPTVVEPDELHVTIAFSRQLVDWNITGHLVDTVAEPATRPGSGLRYLARFGEATVLKFDSPALEQRWAEFIRAGASWDHPSYQPHITLSWQAPADLLVQASPYMGPIVLGAEKWAEVKDDWKDTIVEKLDAVEVDSNFADLVKRLGAKASASDYIDDFVNSDDPRFKGKSKEERINMALGAYYNKMEVDRTPSKKEVQAWVAKLDKMEKAGARHSRSDRDMIQAVHDHAVSLGADCGMRKQLDVDEIRKATVNSELGLVMGYAIICKIDGQPYYDLNIDQNGRRVPEHITEEAMLKAAADFMLNSRLGNEMHGDDPKGTYVFAYPLTTDIAKAMGLNTRVTGLLVAYKPPEDVLSKFKDGTYKGFSIEGRRVSFEEHE